MQRREWNWPRLCLSRTTEDCVWWMFVNVATAHDQADEMMEWYFHELADELCWSIKDECLHKSPSEIEAVMSLLTNLESDSPTRVVHHPVFGALEVSLYGNGTDVSYAERIPPPGGRFCIRAVGVHGRVLHAEECVYTNDANLKHLRIQGRTADRRSRRRARQRVYRAAEIAASMPRMTSSF